MAQKVAQQLASCNILFQSLQKQGVSKKQRRIMHKLMAILTYAGALPFVICAALPLAGTAGIPGLGGNEVIAASYGAIISSFVAGTHWGLAITTQDTTGVVILVLSVILALGAWLAWLLVAPIIAVTAHIKIFALLLIGDIMLYRRDLIDIAYFRMRLGVTGIVILALAAMVITGPA
jgi:hypothetical protein